MQGKIRRMLWQIAKHLRIQWFCPARLTQEETLDLAGSRFGQFGAERDEARILERREFVPDEAFQFVGQLWRGLVAIFEYDKGLGFDQLIHVEDTDDSGFEH